MDQYIGRIVVLITPLFAGVSGWIVAWIGENFPGAPTLDERELTALFIAGAGAAAAAIYKWLDNRGKFERNEAVDGAQR